MVARAMSIRMEILEVESSTEKHGCCLDCSMVTDLKKLIC